MDNNKNSSFPVVPYILLFLAAAAGIYFRLLDLGYWPFAEDEYYIAQSVSNLLKYGVPQYDCGGYYMRGILLQYIIAPLLAFSSDPEWAMRIVSVIFNLAALPAVYILGKRMGGHTVACIAGILFSLSIWEIEFARFARMYAPFQALYLWQMVFLVQATLDKKETSLYWMYGISALALFTYEGAIFIVILNLVPFLLGKQRLSIPHALTITILFITTFLLKTTDFRHMGVPPHMPTEAVDYLRAKAMQDSGIRLPVLIPYVLIKDLLKSPLWAVIFIIPLIAHLKALYYITLEGNTKLRERLVWTGILASTIFNLFGLAIIIFLVSYLVGVIHHNKAIEKDKKHLRLIIIATGSTFLFWFLYSIFVDGYSLHGTIKTLLMYPDLYNKVLLQWLEPMTVQTVITLSALAIITVFFLFRPLNHSTETFRLLLAILIATLALLSMIRTAQTTSRYTFFVYAVVLLLIAAVIYEVVNSFIKKRNLRQITTFGLLAGFIFASEDYSLNHLVNIASKEINFRMEYPLVVKNHYYARTDISSPAKFINDRLKNNDIVLSHVPAIDYYLKRTDYRYVNYKSSAIWGISACSGTRELWTNAKLIYNVNDLYQLTDNTQQNIWMILYADPYKLRGESQKIFTRKYSQYLVYTNIDKTLNVYKIPGRL